MVEVHLVAEDLQTLQSRIDAEKKYSRLKEMLKNEEELALIVNGFSIELIFSSKKLTRDFFELCRYSKCVVCCQLSPK